MDEIVPKRRVLCLHGIGTNSDVSHLSAPYLLREVGVCLQFLPFTHSDLV